MSTKAEQCEYSCVCFHVSCMNGACEAGTRGAVLGGDTSAAKAGCNTSPSLRRMAGGLSARTVPERPPPERLLSA